MGTRPQHTQDASLCCRMSPVMALPVTLVAVTEDCISAGAVCSLRRALPPSRHGCMRCSLHRLHQTGNKLSRELEAGMHAKALQAVHCARKKDHHQHRAHCCCAVLCCCICLRQGTACFIHHPAPPAVLAGPAEGGLAQHLPPAVTRAGWICC